MTELVDVLDLGSSVEKCVGSTPIFPTLIYIYIFFFFLIKRLKRAFLSFLKINYYKYDIYTKDY